MARYQIQSRRLGTSTWIDQPTDAYACRNYNIAVAGARVADAAGQAYGNPVAVRVVRKRWLTGTERVVWTNA
jgi:hypothetical protein